MRTSLLLASLLFIPAGASAELRPDHAEFVERMVTEHGFERDDLVALFTGLDTRQDIIDAITRPAEAWPWHRYRRIFVTDARIEGGVRFWTEHEETIQRAATEFGVDPEIIVSIIGVESNYGLVQGRYPVVEALATLGFDYPPRANFFRSELEHFLLLAREEGIDPATAMGSYAGAMGSPQFISSSYRMYAVDFDQSGGRDLWNSWADIIGSVASYFHAHGWEAGAPVATPAMVDTDAARALATRRLDMEQTIGSLRAAGAAPELELGDELPANLLMLETDDDGGQDHWITLHNFFVITRYNRSPLYSIAVHQLAQAIAAQRAEE